MQAYPQVVPYIPTKVAAHSHRKISYSCVQCSSIMTFNVGEVLPMRCQTCGYRIMRKIKQEHEDTPEDESQFKTLNIKKNHVYLAR
jgi:DNA-directed RNA polymerase subunit RPC12/RpoP